MRRVSRHHRMDSGTPSGGSAGERTEKHQGVFNTSVNEGLFVKGGLALTNGKVLRSRTPTLPLCSRGRQSWGADLGWGWHRPPGSKLWCGEGSEPRGCRTDGSCGQYGFAVPFGKLLSTILRVIFINQAKERVAQSKYQQDTSSVTGSACCQVLRRREGFELVQ